MKSFTDYYDKDYNDHLLRNLVWNDGLLTKIEYSGVRLSYTYSDIPWIVGMICDIIPDTDELLMAQGYYGKLPKMMPSKNYMTSFQYMVTGGLVTKMITTRGGIDVTETTVANIVWE